jgi:hypothetical protein
VKLNEQLKHHKDEVARCQSDVRDALVGVHIETMREKINQMVPLEAQLGKLRAELFGLKQYSLLESHRGRHSLAAAIGAAIPQPPNVTDSITDQVNRWALLNASDGRRDVQDDGRCRYDHCAVSRHGTHADRSPERAAASHDGRSTAFD